MTMSIVMMMRLLSGIMIIIDEKLKRPQLIRSSCPLPGTHQANGIGVCQNMKKERQKNYGHKPDTKMFLSIKFNPHFILRA